MSDEKKTKPNILVKDTDYVSQLRTIRSKVHRLLWLPWFAVRYLEIKWMNKMPKMITEFRSRCISESCVPLYSY